MKTRTNLPPIAPPPAASSTPSSLVKKVQNARSLADSLIPQASRAPARAATQRALRTPTSARALRPTSTTASAHAEQYLESPRGRVVQAQSFSWMNEALGAHPSPASELAVRARLVAELPDAPHGVAEVLVRAVVQGARAFEAAEHQMIQFGGHVGGTSSVLTTKESLRSHHAACRAQLQSGLNSQLTVLRHHFLSRFDRRIG